MTVADYRDFGATYACLCGETEFLAHVKFDPDTEAPVWWGLDGECCNSECNAKVRLPYPGHNA